MRGEGLLLSMIRIFTNNFYFRMQVNAGLSQYRRPHFINQILDVRSRRIARVDDEVGVFFGHLRRPALTCIRK